MMLKKLAIAAALGAVSSVAMAGGFDGPFVQLGIGGSSTSTKFSGTNGTYDGSSSQGNFNGLVAAGWSQSIGQQGFNLAANLFYVIGNQNAYNKNTSESGVENWGSFQSNGNLNNKLKNTFGISIEPGWNFSDSTLGYLKLAWVNSRQTTNYSSTGACTNNDGSTCKGWNDSGSYNKTLNGFGYGLGVKQMVTKNIFAAVDLMGVTYGNVNVVDSVSTKTNQFLGFASVGYKF